MNVGEKVAALCGLVVAVTGALIAIKKVVMDVVRTAQRVGRLVDAFFGAPATEDTPARPGIVARVDALHAAVERVRTEVTPNGGTTSSLGDRVTRIERMLTEHLGLPVDDAHPRRPRE